MIVMGIGKIGINIGKGITAWARTGSKNLLVTKPAKVSIQGLKYAPRLTEDVVQISHSTSNIIQNATKLSGQEYCSIIKNTPRNGAIYNICIGTGGKESPNYIINNYLRTGKINPLYTEQEIKEIIAQADNIFAKNRLSKDTILHRRINDSSFIPNIGATYTDKGYTATSMFDKFADYDYGGINVDIIAPAGTECFIPSNQFYEVVLNRNSNFNVLERSEDYIKLLLQNPL